jgi:hypothetical protein
MYFKGSETEGCTNCNRAVRKGKWKYVDIGGTQALFDLQSDPYEKNDVSSQNPAALNELKNELNRWISNPGDYPTPMGNATPQPLLTDAAPLSQISGKKYLDLSVYNPENTEAGIRDKCTVSGIRISMRRAGIFSQPAVEFHLPSSQHVRIETFDGEMAWSSPVWGDEIACDG